MKISPEQMAFLMSDERDSDTTMCVHNVEINHVHAGIADIPPAYVARFAGHVNYEDENPDTHPDAEYPADKLVTVDVFFSPVKLMELLMEAAAEQLAASKCAHLLEHEATAVEQLAASKCAHLLEHEATAVGMGMSLDEFIERLNGEETGNDDD